MDLKTSFQTDPFKFLYLKINKKVFEDIAGSQQGPGDRKHISLTSLEGIWEHIWKMFSADKEEVEISLGVHFKQD